MGVIIKKLVVFVLWMIVIKKTSYRVRAKVDDNTRDKTNDGVLPMFHHETREN